MHEALCRSFGTTFDIVHDEDGPPITQRTSGLMARQTGLLRIGTVSIDGTKIDANASKLRSVRYDRAKELRAKLADDIAQLTICLVPAFDGSG